MRRTLAALAIVLLAAVALGQPDGAAAYRAFVAWKSQPENKGLTWEAATAKYRTELLAGGMSPAEAGKTLSIIGSWDEGEFYDPVYAGPKRQAPASPSRLLVEAVTGRKPGRALDVGMGNGRNAVYVARQGWDVTGFDTSRSGLAEARKAAAAAGVRIQTVLASDEEFDFGTAQWDLIAILYPIEKRSIYRVRQALRPGGIVVVECGHKAAGNAPFEYDTGELPKILEGFRIVKYEDAVGPHEWVGKPLRLVRLIASK